MRREDEVATGVALVLAVTFLFTAAVTYTIYSVIGNTAPEPSAIAYPVHASLD
jgi:hypothetical protein